jgi:hypothetical protein
VAAIETPNAAPLAFYYTGPLIRPGTSAAIEKWTIMWRARLWAFGERKPVNCRHKAIVILLLSLTTIVLSAESRHMSADQYSVLEDTRAYAQQYIERLPDFICTQTTHRDVGIRNLSTGYGGAVLTSIMHQSSDTFQEQLTYSKGKESYQVLTINGKKDPGADHATLAGAVSWGEFGSLFAQIFDPASHTTFKWNRVEREHGRELWAFNYHVPKRVRNDSD